MDQQNRRNRRDPWTVYESSLITERFLGKGSYGSVILMRDSCYECYAKKTSPMKFFNNLQKELNIMLRLHGHPCIVQAKSPIVHFQNNSENDKVCYIYMEYAMKKTLHSFISEFRQKSQALHEYIIQRATRMILQGLDALHSRGYVHCDLKPSNILLFPSVIFEEPWDLKLADFGLSKEPNTDSSHKILRGTHEYMPPESFKPNTLIDATFDIWSLGCVVYEMFGGIPMQELFEDYYDWTLSKVISPVAMDFLTQCRAPYTQRPTAAELLNHPFITQTLTAPWLTSTTLLEDSTWLPRLPGSIW